jgi:hypothetical protein
LVLLHWSPNGGWYDVSGEESEHTQVAGGKQPYYFCGLAFDPMLLQGAL